MLSFLRKKPAPEALRIVGDVQAMRLSHGDVVVVTLEHYIPTKDQRDWFVENTKLFFPDNKVVVLIKGISVEIVKSAEVSPAC